MKDASFDLTQYVMHHVLDANEWHLPFLPTIHLPEYLTLHGVMLLVASVILIIAFCGLYDKKSRVPSGFTNFLESLVVFIRNEVSVMCLGEKDGKKMAPLFCTFFFFILTLNLMGLIPLFVTATANINVTGALAVITLCLMLFGTIYKNGIKGFISAVKPAGVPAPVLIILVPIEILGIFIKAFALMIRLFANMLAGHIVIFSLLGLVVLVGYAALPAVGLALFINVMEIFIAFLQAYIFTLLSAMFIGLMYHPNH